MQVGAGGDDDEDAQGTDGAGGTERAAAVLAAPDDTETIEQEHDAQIRWRDALAALADLRAGDGGGGAEAAEIIRRHHGLDSVAEDRGGATGESFASIAERPLATSGRTLTREGVRKIYVRGIAALRQILAGRLPDLEVDVDAEDPSPIRTQRSPFRPLPAPVVAPSAPQTTEPPATREADDGGAWAAWREAAAAVVW